MKLKATMELQNLHIPQCYTNNLTARHKTPNSHPPAHGYTQQRWLRSCCHIKDHLKNYINKAHIQRVLKPNINERRGKSVQQIAVWQREATEP